MTATIEILVQPSRATLLLVLLGACTAKTGTISLSLVTAPGSTLLDGVERLHVIATSPHLELDATRGATGFDLAFDLAADGSNGALIVDGYAAGGALVATGASPAFPIAALDASVAIYMAPPRSLLASPAVLATPVSRLAAGALTYGAILAGGADAAGMPSSALAIYNAFDHVLTPGLAMPAARAGQALGVAQGGIVYLFGGVDATGAATGNLWRFDTTVAPSGSYFDLGDHPELARADQALVLVGADQLVLSGTPVVELAALGNTLAPRATPASLPASGAGLTTQDGVPSAIFGEAGQLVRFRADVVDTLPAAVPPDPIATAMPPNSVVVAGSAAQLLRVDATSGAIATAAIATPRKDAALAATARYLVVAGGTDAGGAIVGTAEVFDASLAPVVTLPLVVPRTGASALPLPNGQIMIVGGVDATGAPIGTIELFTPDSVE